MGVSASTLERKTYVLYVVGVSTAIPSQRKLYMLYIEVCGHPTFSRGSTAFLYAIYYMCVTTPVLFSKTYDKSMGVGTHTMYRQVYLLKYLYEHHGCMNIHKVLHVNFKMTYDKG